MKSGEQELVRIAGEQLGSTVLIAPHHGSQSSSTDFLLDQVQPEVVVVSAGWVNPWKFPHSKVVANYKRRGYQIFRTDQHGAVTLTTDGDYLLIEPMLSICLSRLIHD
jgi:competence protein ComEC